MEIELYAPRGVDGQTPHLRDELYVVASGTGEFVNGPDRHPFGPGEVYSTVTGSPSRIFRPSTTLAQIPPRPFRASVMPGSVSLSTWRQIEHGF